MGLVNADSKCILPKNISYFTKVLSMKGNLLIALCLPEREIEEKLLMKTYFNERIKSSLGKIKSW